MDLTQPVDFRLRLSQIAHHAVKPGCPIDLLGLAHRVKPRQIQLPGAGSLQRIDGRMKRMDLAAELFLFAGAEVHSIEIHRHKFLSATHQLLRQRAQQAEALLEQRKIFFDFKVHGLCHLVQFVLFCFFWDANLRRIG